MAVCITPWPVSLDNTVLRESGTMGHIFFLETICYIYVIRVFSPHAVSQRNLISHVHAFFGLL